MANIRFFTKRFNFGLNDLKLLLPNSIINDNNSDLNTIKGVNTLIKATNDELSFCHNAKYVKQLSQTNAGIIVTNSKFSKYVPNKTIIIESDTPYRDYANIVEKLYLDIGSDLTSCLGENNYSDVKIAKTSTIAKDVTIGKGTIIESSACIGRGVTIGKNCYIAPNVSISHTNIGNNVIINPGCCIGQSGFGFYMDSKGHVSVKQIGSVIIEDNVDIGANVCIDRGTLEDTIIGQGTRIDNLVQIGHGVKIGKNCVIVSQVGISGSSNLGNFVVLGGQAGIAGHINIADNAQVAAQSGVFKSINDVGGKVGGCPAVPVTQWHRQCITLAKITKNKQNTN